MIFPMISQNYAFVKKPQWSTLVKRTASGKEVRSSYYSLPTWEFTINFIALRGDDYNNLFSFVNQVRGAFDTFNFQDPSSRVVGASLGIGDGSETQFQLSRVINEGFTEYPNFPSFEFTGFGEAGGVDEALHGYGVPVWPVPYIYLDGILQGGVGGEEGQIAYTISQTGLVTFAQAPGDGVEITTDFDFFYLCRLKEDSQQFEWWAYPGVWRASITIISIKS